MSSPLSKTEKEKQKMIQEKCQTILAAMLRDEDNKYCVDCDAKGPRWASWNLGIFLCIRCAGIHRNLGVHISKVKSVNLDSWTPEQVVSLQQMGNSRARAVYEANLPDNFRRPQTDSTLESFIRAKYENKKYIAREWVCPPPLKVSWDAEIEMELKRKKEAKRKVAGGTGSPVAVGTSNVDLPSSASRSRPTEATASPKEAAVAAANPTTAPVELAPPVKASSAAQDLLGLDTAVNGASSEDDLFGGLILNTGPAMPPTNGNASSATAPATHADELNFFNQQAPSAAEKRTLDKNSILALYNQGVGATPSPAALPMQNMYSVPRNVFPAQPGFGATPVAMNPGLMAGGMNPLVQNNMFSSPVFAANGQNPAIPGGAAATSSVAQLSHQLNGLNFGPSPVSHNPMMPGAPIVPGSNMMMMSSPMMAMNPQASPYTFASSGQQQQPTTLSTNLWQ